MIIKKVKIPIYEQTLYVSITEDYSKDEEEYECIWRPGKENFSGYTSGLNNQYLIILNKKIEELLVCEDKISKLKEIVPEFDHRLN